MSVAAILAEKGRDVVTVTHDTSVAGVIAVLAQKKIGAAVVMRDGTVCGIVSERDLVRDIASLGAEALQHDVASCMTENVVAASEDDTIEDVMQKMTTGRFRHMPVMDGDNLVGIISIGDVVKRKIAQAEQDVEAMKQYISG